MAMEMFAKRLTPRGIRAALASGRLVVAAGFAGLLILMAFAELDGYQALHRIEATSDRIREDYLHRTRVLEAIRFDLYVSGTYARDYLLEPEARNAEAHRRGLEGARDDMGAALRQYEMLATVPEATPFSALEQSLAAYWQTLEPVFRWNADQRQSEGYAFLRDQVFPRRTAMLGIADRIGSMNESQLSAGKVRVDQTFSRYRNRVSATIGLTLGLGLLLASFSLRRMMNLEAASAAHYEEVSQARTLLRQLSARLVEAQESERRAISRELHEEVGQELTGVLVEMANLSTLARTGDAGAVVSKADEIKKLLEDSIGTVRGMSLLLRPSMLDDLGLVPALEWQARETMKSSGLSVRVTAEQVSDDLPEEHKTCVYRIVQEALHNAVQHAGARQVRIVVRQEERRLLLIIQDDGKGFNAQQERGMGLVGIEERVSHLGGNFAVESSPGHGVTVRVVLPIPEPLRQAASNTESEPGAHAGWHLPGRKIVSLIRG